MTAVTLRQQRTEIISIDEGLEIIKDNIPAPSEEKLPLEESVGRYLAMDMIAPEPSPRYTNSAMDGFAVRWRDVLGATAERPVTLHIVGESRAGGRFRGLVGPGEAARISTGAMVPDGSDTVIRVEDTVEEDGQVRIHAVGSQGQDVRRQGEEFAAGDLLLARGTRVTAPRAALLASVGIGMVPVLRPCRVAVLVTGSELVSVGEEIGADQIRDSNMLMLRAAIEEAGGAVVQCRRIADDLESTRRAIGEAEGDVIICSGGISVGRHDHVKKGADGNDFVPLFWRILQKPGKPLYFARRGDRLLFGLPGNPVSAFMCFTHYVRPLITTLNGLSFGWPMVSAEAVEDIENTGKRPNMMRVRLKWRPHSGHYISSAAKQGSHMLTSLAHGDGYIILQPKQRLKKGERIDVYRYDFIREPVWGGEPWPT